MAPINSFGDGIEFADLSGMDADEFRCTAHQAVDLIADYLSTIRKRPVFTPMQPAERERLLGQELPSRGLSAAAILEAFRESILTRPMGNGHPRFFGWVNSPSAPIGIVAEFLSAAMNPSCAGGDHAAIYLERAVVRWLAELVGFPLEPGGMGLLVSGGSMASLTLPGCRASSRCLERWLECQVGRLAGVWPSAVGTLHFRRGTWMFAQGGGTAGNRLVAD